MAKRFIDTNIFRKDFLRSLEAPYKLLFIYIINECDHAGLWDVEMDVANMRLGLNLSQTEAEEILGDKIQVISSGAKWFIPSFIEFQYGELKPENRVHNSVLQSLEKYKIKPLTSPLQGGKDKDKDKDKDKKKRGSGGKTNFDDFYSKYPKKKAPVDAKRAWDKLSQSDQDAAIQGIGGLIYSTDPQYYPYPATYLNGKRWLDDMSEPWQKKSEIPGL